MTFYCTTSMHVIYCKYYIINEHITGGKTAIYFTAVNEIRQIIPSRKEYSGTISWGRHMSGLDIDADRKMIYWTDISMKMIERAGIPTDMKLSSIPQPQNLEIEVQQPEGIAIDFVTKLVLYSYLLIIGETYIN